MAELRAKLGWTQQELADRVGISRVAVSHVESGMTDPGERTVTLLAGVFDMEPHDLVVGTSYPRGRAERLPVVTARHTDVELALELLANDLRWLERTGGAYDGLVLREWEVRLRALLAVARDARERVTVHDALAGVRRRVDALEPA